MSAARGAATPASPFDDLDAIRARLAGGPSLVALDFDGTLTEIVHDPAAPGIPAERRSLLATIPAPDRRLAIVSGRKLEDVRRRVGLPGVIYVGNHGLEIEGPDVERRPPPEVADRLARLLGVVAGRLRFRDAKVEIEDKTWTATLHLRPRGDTKRHQAVAEAIGGPVDEAGFVLRPGKASWEIRPAGAFDKGDALRWLIDAAPDGSAARSLYVGDDITDEDAFSALPDGITVRVGDPDQETAARYRLLDPAAVYRLLEELFG
ncbi:MAG: trehalose-phosphatase [Gemmatimonadota bacterium]